MKYFHGCQFNPLPEPPSYGNIKIYDAGTPTQPGVVLDSEPFWTPAGNAWFQFNLSNPVIIDASHDYWYSVEVINADPGNYPLGMDDGPAVDGKGDWCFMPGNPGYWVETQIYGLDWNFNHMVGLEPVNFLQPPVIHGPTNGRTLVGCTFWTDPITNPYGDSFYCKWDWNDGTMSEWLGPYPSGSNITASHTWTHAGVYGIKAKLKDTNGGVSNWSDPYSITILANNPPGTPSITGSIKGKPGVPYIYTFTTTDPENDDVYYFIDWGDNTSSGVLGPYSSGDTITKSHTWITKGTYVIKTKAKDIYGDESGWGTFLVTMPLSYEPPHFRFLNWLFDRFPQAFPILRQLLGY